MENKINIAEILKDCPKGMELDCPMFRGLEFVRIDEYNKPYPIICRVKTAFGSYNVHAFTEHGSYGAEMYSKCVIFPKGKTTWEGFQRPFKDGDVVFYNDTIAIFKEWGDETLFRTYVIKYLYKDFAIIRDVPLFGKSVRREIRFATEEEKKKLFDAIKVNGYKWNEETKTLDKLVEPNFKVGDRIIKRDSIVNSWIVSSVSSEYYGLKLPKGSESIGVLSIAEQDDYELVSDIKPKFKVGDRIKDKDKDNCYSSIVVEIKDDCFIIKTLDGLHNSYLTDKIPFSEQDDWELVPNIKPRFKVGDRIKSIMSSSYYTVVDIKNDQYFIKSDTEKYPYQVPFSNEINYKLVPNKFDITTLVPFESRVLVRSSMDGLWKPAVFGFRNGYNDNAFYIVGGSCWKQCIPYLNNEHLCGTTNDCDEFYKTW